MNRILLLPKSASIIVFTISILIMFVWIHFHGSPPIYISYMKFNTALCLGLTSVSLWIMKDPSREWNKNLITVAQIISGIISIFSVITLSEYAFDLRLGIDQIFIADNLLAGKVSYPGRMSPGTSISLLLLNLGLLVLDHKPKKWRLLVASTFLVPAAILPLYAMVGYLYGEHALYQYLPEIRMSWITSFSLLNLSIGALFCRPNQGPIKVLTSDSIGGVATRKLLPLIFLLPMLLGYVVLVFVQNDYLDFRLGFAFLIGTLIIILVCTIVLTGSRIDELDIERLRLIDELGTSVRAREELLSIASHELKTPLSALHLQNQIMQRQLLKEGGNERFSKFVNQVEQQSIKLNRLIDDMLDLSRIRTGRISLEKEQIDLCELVYSLIERLRPLFEKSKSGVPEVTGCDHTIGTWDRMRLEQVLNNLFTNAIRYGEGRPIHVNVKNLENRVLISVQDFGMGIPEEKRDIIFDRFERAGMMKEKTGLGLGLFITKQIVLAHGGKIWLESKVGSGSTFFLELPK